MKTFVYDSIIAFGLAACDITQPGSYFTGEEHFDQIVRTSFEGASGKIVLIIKQLYHQTYHDDLFTRRRGVDG
jgi:hypothetical protein